MKVSMKFVYWPVAAALLLLAPDLHAQKFDEQFDHWPVDLKINGVIVASGGLDDSDPLLPVFYRFRELQTTVIHDDNLPRGYIDQIASRFDSWALQSVLAGNRRQLLPPLEELPSTALTIETVEENLAAQVRQATQRSKVICLFLGKALSSDQRQQLVESADHLQAFLDDQGVLFCDGGATQSLSSLVITNDTGIPIVQPGAGLLPDCVVKTEHTNSNLGRLQSVLAVHPTLVGVGIQRNTAIILSGRKIQAIGSGSATFCLTANQRQPYRVQTIGEPNNRRSPEEWLIDLTEWRRDAIDRTLPAFPAAKPETPHVDNGTLVIVGGGGMPKGLMEQFVELAGGKEEARLVYVPCSEQDRVRPIQSTVEMWKKMGVKHATFIHTKNRHQANNDEDFFAPLNNATGIWFGGGRQWNFSDSYYGTKTHQLMKEVLQRGGVIGGSSAGASIQARYLARATPIGNFRIMAPGYERGGLGFISGVAIDQHFSQRGRQKDMTQLMKRHPQLLGIGLDEATAIIVQGSRAEVVGRGRAHFYDRSLSVAPDRPVRSSRETPAAERSVADYVALPKGAVYNLAERKVIRDPREAESDDPTDSNAKGNAKREATDRSADK